MPQKNYVSGLKRFVTSRGLAGRRKVAMPPGYLEYTGDKTEQPVRIEVVNFSEHSFEVKEASSIEECLQLEDRENPTWVRVIGLHDVEKLSRLMDEHEIHPLIQEDVLNQRHRPKVETWEDSIVVIQKLIDPPVSKEQPFHVENITCLLMEDLLITFQETDHQIFNPVLKRLKSGKGRIRKSGCDYLLWALLDAVTDHYFLALDQLEEDVSRLDERLQADITAVNPQEIYGIKREITLLNRMLRPSREVVAKLDKSESKLMTETVTPFMRDLYDHTIHVIETTEHLRDLSSSLRDFYLSSVSNRMNEIMKVLTCFATIFLPLSFLAGVYGMNFDDMPELHWKWAYPMLWGAFLTTFLGMLWYFRRKKWI
ncbi:cobalt/magnesium transport protein CorA [Rubritalea halochordaticola]|uniref:Magnesium transport protein CorA n=1 Tax=Rubritalea halochordaticola TaxID=714537 RepID=A0ABP9V2F7_9BACT